MHRKESTVSEATETDVRSVQRARRAELDAQARAAVRRAIAALSEQGLSHAAIASRVAVAPSTITKWSHGQTADGLGPALALIGGLPEREAA